MIVYDNNKEYRNLQEQVGKNMDDIAQLKGGISISYECLSSDVSGLTTAENVGKYLYTTDTKKLILVTKDKDDNLQAVDMGDWPKIPANGTNGVNGTNGTDGTVIKTVGLPLPSAGAFREGDMVIVCVAPEVGNLYKKMSGAWKLQCNLRGAQGPAGPNGSTVVANPVDAASDDLSKLKIDGVTYDVLSSTLRDFLGNIANGEFSYISGQGYQFGDDPVSFDYPVTFYSGTTIDNGNDLDINGGSINLKSGALLQAIDTNDDTVVEISDTGIDVWNERVGSNINVSDYRNFVDGDGHYRFVEGTIDTETISGVTWTYNKWVLSGNHLMLVLAGEVASGTTLSIQSLGGVDFTGDNAWMNSKIVPIFASSVIAINDAKGYYDDWNSNNMQTTLMKTSTGVYFYLIQTPTYSQTGHFRIQFDLLID